MMNRRNSFQNRFDSHDRQMRLMNRVFWVMFAVAAVFIVCTWIFYGYIAFKAVDTVQSTENIPAALGKMVGEFEKARQSVK